MCKYIYIHTYIYMMYTQSGQPRIGLCSGCGLGAWDFGLGLRVGLPMSSPLILNTSPPSSDSTVGSLTVAPSQTGGLLGWDPGDIWGIKLSVLSNNYQGVARV